MSTHVAWPLSSCNGAGSSEGNSTRLNGAGGLGGSALGTSAMGTSGAGGCVPCIDVTQQCQQVRAHNCTVERQCSLQSGRCRGCSVGQRTCPVAQRRVL